jgi:hypothetical protein
MFLAGSFEGEAIAMAMKRRESVINASVTTNM